jgi:hypothetical protein
MNRQAIALSILIMAMSACKKTEPAAPAYKAPDSSYGLIYDKVFTTSCALSGCHANESHASHAHTVTLEGANVYEELINIAPKNSQALTAGLKLIAPNDTTKSFLYQKLIYNRSVHKYGAPMPLGGLKLTTNQIEFIKLWIAEGAPKEGHVVNKNLIQ